MASRVQLNRAALDEVYGGLADGVFGIASAIALEASRNAPDETPFGEGLVDHGGAAVWIKGRKVAEMTTGGPPPIAKPKALKVRSKAGDVVGLVGFGFPGRFQEMGTVHQPSRPFLTPAALRVVGRDANVILSKEMQARLRRRTVGQ